MSHADCKFQKQCFKIINIPPGEEGGVDIPPGEEGGVDGTMSFYAGNKMQMLSCFVDSENQPLTKNVCALTLLLDESSADRLSQVRGFMNIEQEQHLYVVSKSVVNLKPHDRLHYAGTNMGHCHLPDHYATMDIPRGVAAAAGKEERGHWQGRQHLDRRARARGCGKCEEGQGPLQDLNLLLS